jgi:hypothetical protein
LPPNQRLIRLPVDLIAGIEGQKIDNSIIFCRAGAYDIIGAMGCLLLSDGTKFDFRYELDPSKTRCNAGSAYSLSPCAFIDAKFMRHAMKAYYSIKLDTLPEVEVEADDLIVTSITEEMEERMQDIEDMTTERKQKLETIMDKYKN